MKISACVIVKNEAENLPQWLHCMEQLADELIVVDTGSSDDTVAIAQAAGARIFSFVWKNDFSLAKNYAIEQATGDWIVFLDADEYIRDEDIPRLKQVVQAKDRDKKAAGIVLQLINIDKDTGENQGTAFFQIRVFRNRSWIRYEGSIHEHLKNRRENQQARMDYVGGINIYHTGYTPRILQDKIKRNLAMLIERQRTQGSQPLDDFHFADCYYGLQEYEKAIPYAQKAIKAKAQAVGQEMRPYLVLIQSMMLSHREKKEVAAVITAAQQRFPQESVFYFLAGEFYWEQQEYATAIKAIKQGITFYEENRSEKDEGSLASRLLPRMYEHWAEYDNRQGNKAEEAHHLLAAVQLEKYRADLLVRLLTNLIDEEPAEIISLLNGLYDKKKDAFFLIAALRQSGMKQACLYYDRAAGGILREEERFLLGNHPEAAAATVMERLEQVYVLGCALWDTLDEESRESFAVLLPERYRRVMQGKLADREDLRLQRRIRRVQMRVVK